MNSDANLSNNILPLIENRFSINEFLPKPISKRIIQNIIVAGQLAPSAKNRQAWRFIAVTDKPVLKKISKACFEASAVKSAPLIIVLCTTNINYKMPNGELSYPIDIGVALSFMMLQAQYNNLGSCPMSTYNHHEIVRVLSVPYSMRAAMILAVGHPTVAERFRTRLPRTRISSHNHW